MPNTYNSIHNDDRYDAMKFDVANQEDEYPRMPMSRGTLVEPSGEFKRIPHPTIKSASSKELPMENTIS